MKMMLNHNSLGYRPRQRGAILPLAVAAMLAIVGLTGVGIDIGFIVWKKRQLQAAVEAATLAGAQDLLTQDATRIKATVANYAARTSQGAVGGGGEKVNNSRWYNDLENSANVTVNPITPENVELRDLGKSQVGLNPGTQSRANALRVTQTAIIRPFFMSLFGMNSITISARAAASAGGGSGAPPVNVSVVLDTSGSMDTSVSCGSLGTMSRLRCAKRGMLTLVSQLTSPGNTVGLTVFPPRVSSTAINKDLDCNSNMGASDLAYYMAGSSPDFWRDTSASISTIISWANASDFYRNGSLNTSNNLIKAIGQNASGISGNCGAEAPGGRGTFYAQAIRQAQRNFDQLNNGQQNIMIILSDGDATSTYFSPEKQVEGTIYDGETANVDGRISGFARFTGTIGGNRTTARTGSDNGTTLRIDSIAFGPLETGADSPITSGSTERTITRIGGTGCHDTNGSTNGTTTCTGTLTSAGTYLVNSSTRISTPSVFTQVTTGRTLTVTSVNSGHVKLVLGEPINFNGVTPGTKIIGDSTNGAVCPTATSATELCNGNGGTGTYLVNNPHRMSSDVVITTSRRAGTTLRVSRVIKGSLAVGDNIVEQLENPTVNTTISAMATTSGCINEMNNCTGTGTNGTTSAPATYKLANSYNVQTTDVFNVFSQQAKQQCQQGIVAANEAKAAGTQVYVLSYGAPNVRSQGSTMYCEYDTSTLSPLLTSGNTTTPCNALQWMAGNKNTQTNTRPNTVSPFFYSVNSGCPSPNAYGDINRLFEEIAEGITNVGSRTIPDDAW